MATINIDLSTTTTTAVTSEKVSCDCCEPSSSFKYTIFTLALRGQTLFLQQSLQFNQYLVNAVETSQLGRSLLHCAAQEGFF